MNDNLFDYKTYFRSPDSGPILLTTKKKIYNFESGNVVKPTEMLSDLISFGSKTLN